MKKLSYTLFLFTVFFIYAHKTGNVSGTSAAAKVIYKDSRTESKMCNDLPVSNEQSRNPTYETTLNVRSDLWDTKMMIW